MESVSTLLSENITQTKAKLKGVCYAKNFSYSEVGIEYKKDTEENYTKIILASNITGSHFYSHDLTNLFPSTKIQYRFYTESEEYGTQYGETKEFTTLPVTVTYSSENQVKKLTQSKADLQVAITNLEIGDMEVSNKGYQIFQGNYIEMNDFDKATLTESSDPMTFIHQGYLWKIADGYVVSGTPIDGGGSSIFIGSFAPYNTSIITTVTSKTNSTITFSWRTSGGFSSDRLYFYVDGVQKDYISASTTTFRQVSINLSIGEHTVEWRFSRTSYTIYPSNSFGTGMVKDINITNTMNLSYGTWINTNNESQNDMEISSRIMELTPDIPYSYRPFVAFTNGYVEYGKSNTFTIQPVNVSTQNATSISQTASTLSAIFTGNAVFTNGGFEILDTSLQNSEWQTIAINSIEHNNIYYITYNHTQLLPQRTYQYRAFVNTDEGETFTGNIIEFRTDDIVSTGVVNTSDITQSKATITGNIIGEWNDILSKGFEWKKSDETMVGEVFAEGEFSVRLENLQYNTSYTYRAFIVTSFGTVYDDWKNFTTKDIIITTGNNSSTQTTATMYGSINLGDAIANVTSVGIYCSGYLYADEVSFSWSVTKNNLIPNGNYSYYAVATVDGKQYSASSNSFTTQATSASVSSSDITQTSAMINASYSVGDATFTTGGIQYGQSTSSYTTLNDTLNYRITELAPNTTYYYRSYITTTEGGTVYSNWQNFTTKAITLTVQQADAISNTSATIHSDIDCDTYSSAEFGFEWRKYDAPEMVPSNTVIAEQYEGKLLFSLRSLVPSTYYKYCAYCKYQDQMYYSDWTAFGTADVFVLYTPNVVTIATTDVENNCIIIHSYVLEGSEDILQQGFEYWVESVLRSSAEETNTILTSGTNNTVTLLYSDLLPNTTYKFRAFAKTASGTTYGETCNFQTPDFGNTGIESMQEKSQILIYPNPVKEVLYIAGASGIQPNETVEIYHLTGKKIVDGQLNGNSINVSSLSPGVYILKIGNYTSRFVVD